MPHEVCQQRDMNACTHAHMLMHAHAHALRAIAPLHIISSPWKWTVDCGWCAPCMLHAKSTIHIKTSSAQLDKEL